MPCDCVEKAVGDHLLQSLRKAVGLTEGTLYLVLQSVVNPSGLLLLNLLPIILVLMV